MAANLTDSLSPEQEAAVVALLNETSVARAAAACGVGERTLYRWLDEPQFGEAYRKARRENFKQAMGIAQKYAPTALGVLVTIATDPRISAGARVSAAAHVARFSRESIELDDLAARVQALERASKGAGP